MKLLGFVFLVLLALKEYECTPHLDWLGSNKYYKGHITNCFGSPRQWREPFNIQTSYHHEIYPLKAHDKPYETPYSTYPRLPLHDSIYGMTYSCWYDNGTPYIPYSPNTWYRPYDQHTPYYPYFPPIVPQYIPQYVRQYVPQYVPQNVPQYVPHNVPQLVPPYGSPYYQYDTRYPAYNNPNSLYYVPYYLLNASTYSYSFYTPFGQVHCRKSTEKTTQNPVVKPVEQTTGKAEEQTTEQATENPLGKTTDIPIQKPVDKLGSTPSTTSADSSSENFSYYSTINPFDDMATENVFHMVTENPFNVEKK